MPTYKVVDASQLDADLTSVADHIRTKGDTSDALSFPSDFCDAIDAIQTGGGLPSFINHLESGSFTLESGSNIWVDFTDITFPKGIVVFNSDFDLASDKTDKALLGAYMAAYIAGNDTLTPNSSGFCNIAYAACYMANFGQGTNQKYPSTFRTISSSRGISGFNPTTKKFYVIGFGTNEYDFKYNIPYYWMAWD